MDGDLLVNRDGVRIVSQSEVEAVRFDILVSVSEIFVFFSAQCSCISLLEYHSGTKRVSMLFPFLQSGCFEF
jgi:hypothetical protein